MCNITGCINGKFFHFAIIRLDFDFLFMRIVFFLAIVRSIRNSLLFGLVRFIILCHQVTKGKGINRYSSQQKWKMS